MGSLSALFFLISQAPPQLSTFNTMVLPVPRVPSHVSNGEIPTRIFNLPPHLQPQPALVMSACSYCLISLTTRSKGEVSNGTIAGMLRVFCVDFCKRKNNYGPCEACQAAHKGSCIPVSFLWRSVVSTWLILSIGRGIIPSGYQRSLLPGLLRASQDCPEVS